MISSTPCFDEVEIATCEVQKKQLVFQNWIEDSRDVLLRFKTAQILNHQNVKAELEQLEKKKIEFKEQACIKSFSISQQKELNKLEEEIKKLSSASVQKQQITEIQSEKLKENENAFKQKTEDISSKEADVNKQLEKLDKGLRYFEQNLGLKVVRHPEEHLTFIFTQIDQKSPQKEFSFDLAVEGTPGIYKVLKCSSRVSELDFYVEELNNDNDLKRFLCQMRNSFRKNCQ